MKKGNLFVISGPSGVGKNTVQYKLLKLIPDLNEVITYTTRAPRGSEKHGRDYQFVNEKKFRQMIDENKFLEWAKVHGHYYGTSKTDIVNALRSGQQLLINIDVQGALQIKKLIDNCHLFFLMPENKDQLRRHLLQRGDLKAEEIELRLKNSDQEIEMSKKYDYVFTNIEGKIDDLTEAISGQIKEIMQSGNKN